MITKGVEELCAHAEGIIETWSVEQALDAYNIGDVVFVDIRDIRELAVHEMGLAPVCHMLGGYAAWRDTGGATEEKKQRPPKP